MAVTSLTKAQSIVQVGMVTSFKSLVVTSSPILKVFLEYRLSKSACGWVGRYDEVSPRSRTIRGTKKVYDINNYSSDSGVKAMMHHRLVRLGGRKVGKLPMRL
jgi:hypothetical protein